MEISPVVKLFFWLTLLLLTYYYLINWIIHTVRLRSKIRNKGRIAKATVVDHKIFPGVDDDRQLYMPVLKFTDKRGHHFFVDSEIYNNWKHKEGTEFIVYYLPEDPRQHYVKGTVPLPIFASPFILIIIIFIFVGLIKTIQELL